MTELTMTSEGRKAAAKKLGLRTLLRMAVRVYRAMRDQKPESLPAEYTEKSGFVISGQLYTVDQESMKTIASGSGDLFLEVIEKSI